GAGVRQLASGGDAVVYWTRSTGEPIRVAALNLALLATLVALALGVALCFRALPRAYGWYALAGLLLPLSTPGHALPLLSLPRWGRVPPLPRRPAQLAAGGFVLAEEAIAAALEAEMRFYRANHDRGRDAASLVALRRECASVLGEGLGPGAPSLDRLTRCLLD